MGWEYGERTYKRCRHRGSAVPKGMCSRLQDVIEHSFDTMAVNLADIFNMSTRDADGFGRSVDFQKNMDNIVDEIIEKIISKKTESEREISNDFSMKFFKWYTNVLKNEPEPDLSSLNLPPGMKFSGPGGKLPPNFNPENAPWLQKNQPPAQGQGAPAPNAEKKDL